MVQRARGPRLEFEAAAPLGVGGHARKGLDGHLARQFGPRVARPVHLAHAPGADGGDHFVDAEAGAGGEGHVPMPSESRG